MRTLSIALAAGLWLAGCSHKLPTATVQVDGRPVRVEIAADAESRAMGLMHRDHLPASEGMLFIYPEDQLRAFWMKDTRIPLSIAFADGDGKIVRITDMKPLSRDHTSSIYPARFALEMNKGWFAEHDVRKGALITELPTVEVR